MAEESLFKVLFENMSSGAAIYEVKNDGRYGRDYIIKDFNAVSRQIEGMTREEVIGKSLFDLRPNIDDYGLIETFRKVWKTGKPTHFPSKQYVDENYSNWYENQVFKLPTGEIVAMYNDVTENEQKNVELREKNILLETLIDDAPYGVFIIDENGIYKTVNKKACEQTGYSRNEILGNPITMMLPEGDPYNAAASLGRLHKDGHIDENHYFVTKDGDLRTWNIHAVKLNEKSFVGFKKDITEELKLKEELKAKAEEYQALFDNAALGIGYYTTDGKVIWYNKVAAQNMAGKPEDFKGKTVYELFPREAADEYTKRLEKAIQSKERTSYEDELNLPMGTVTFYSTYNCIHNREGKIIGVQIISQDITDIKKTEKELIEKQRDYQILFEEAPLGYQSLDVNGNFLAINEAWSEMLGYGNEEVIGHNFSEFLHPDYIELFQENFPNFKRVGSTCAIFRMKRKRGDYIIVRFDGKIVYDENNDFIKSQCMLQDITYAQEMEQRLRESENKFRDMFEEAPLGYQLLDKESKILDVNKAWCGLLGYKKEEVLGTDSRLLLPSEYMSQLKDYQEDIHNNIRRSIELEVIKKDKTRAHIKYYGRVIRDSSGEFIRTLGIIQDITKTKKLEKTNLQMEAQLRNQQKLESIGVLAGGVAHEINNPINGIMNYGQLILDLLGESTECSEYAREIIHESQRIASIVKDLLQFSRHQKQSFRNESIEEIIRHTVTLIGTIMKHDQIELVVDIEKDLPEINCRGQQIQQVLMNLLTNARDTLNDKYPGYDQYKIIKLKCSKIYENGDEWVRISIKDNGNGIPENVRESIFDPFFTTKGRDEGSGLGLSISYGITKEHKGRLYYETEEGKYTEFFVELPAANSN